MRIIAMFICILMAFGSNFAYAQAAAGVDEAPLTAREEAVAQTIQDEDIGEQEALAAEQAPISEFDDYEAIRSAKNEEVSLRTSNSKTYRIDENNMQTVVYTEDIHYYDASAGYQEIDNAIVENNSQYGNTFYHLSNKANAYSAHFADADEGELVRLNYQGKGLSITPVQEEVEAPDLEPAQEASPDSAVLPSTAAPVRGADEEMQTHNRAQIEESPILKKADAAGSSAKPDESAAAQNTSPGGEAAQIPAEAPPAPTAEIGGVKEEAAQEMPKEDVVTAQMLASSAQVYPVFQKSESLQQLVYPENSVLYEEILPNIDILYETKKDGLKEYIVIKAPTQQNEFLFDYTLYGLTPFTDENGNISFQNELGEDIFLIDKLFAVDDNEVITQDVCCEVISTEGGTARVKVTLDKDYLTDPSRAFPVIIDPSTMVTGSSTTKDTYVNQASPSTNYYLSDYLKVGKSGGKEMWSLIKFDLPTNISASSVTNAKIRLKYDSGSRPSSLYASRVTSSWTSSSVTWNNKPSASTATDAPNRSTKGALDGADWYVLHVTTSTKNMLNKSKANYGWKIHDAGLGSSSNTTYRSSDYGSPYRPELVIDHTGSTTPPSTTYGSRAYESSTGDGQNCMGYALDIQQFIDYKVLFETYSSYATDSDRTAINQSKNYTDLMTVVERVMRRYMNDKLGYNGYTAISSYNSSISSNSYRTVMRLGVNDKNNIQGWQINYSNSDNLNVNDEWDYHWRYQIKDGRWAEKSGNLNSQIVSGSSGTKNPGASIWESSVNYESACKYYAIKMH